MKSLILVLFRAFLSVIYAFDKLLLRQRDMVVFLSRQSNAPSVEFRLIADEIKALSPDTEVSFCCRQAAKSEVGLSYLPVLFRQMRLLARAKGCVVDTYCIPVSLLRHRKNLRVVQIWHSIAIIKQFGWQTVGKPEGSSEALAKAMRMHRGYDYVVAGSEAMRPILAQTMHHPLESVLALGLPLADVLLSADSGKPRAEFLLRHPEAEGKKIITYAPTLRRNRPVDCAALLRALAGEDRVVHLRLHPVDRQTSVEGMEGVIIDPDFSSDEAVLFSDCLITDYSGISAEAALRDVPVYFYIPDIEDYSRECGLNINPALLFPEVSFSDPEALSQALEGEYDEAIAERLRDVLAGGCTGSSARSIAGLVLYGQTGI